WGVDAEATRQATRGEYRNRAALWRIEAGEQGRLRKSRPIAKSGPAVRLSRQESLEAWRNIAMALGQSESRDDRLLANRIDDFVKGLPMMQRKTAPDRDDGTPAP